ncbi:DUF1697 domain-containing protein [Lacticaseibacillus absianus]|uniref:DUF1697 domain-containing protein n=1 Tax=Lacticaseibacillus absianus TaxID=2729623 RepID=UPI0015CB5661|nr:DUF1697 domain-containing protein [Lacticaseibacillus absianus]
MTYLLLLRGVNVGAHRVPMATLRAQLTEAGATGVVSYINSGNLLFDDPRPDVSARVARVLATYPFGIGFVCYPVATYLDLVATAPDWWGAPGDLRHNVLFKLPGYQAGFDARLQAQLTPQDRVAITPQAIFWTAPGQAHFSQSLYAKLTPQPFYPLVSIRNRNTTLKLAALATARVN